MTAGAQLMATNLAHRADGSDPASGTVVPLEEFSPNFSVAAEQGPQAVWSSIYPPGGISSYCNGTPCKMFTLRIDFTTPVTAAAVVVESGLATVRFLDSQDNVLGKHAVNNPGTGASIVALVSPTRFNAIEIPFSDVGKISELYALPCP